MLASQVFQTALSNKKHMLESRSEWRKHTALFLSDVVRFCNCEQSLIFLCFLALGGGGGGGGERRNKTLQYLHSALSKTLDKENQFNQVFDLCSQGIL